MSLGRKLGALLLTAAVARPLASLAACSPFEGGSSDPLAEADGSAKAPAAPLAPELLDAGTALLGASDVGSSTELVSRGFRDAYGYPVTRAGTGRHVWVYLPPDPDRTTKGAVVGVYADVSGVSTPSPGRLVAKGTRVDLRDGWNDFALDVAVEAKAGQFLWIAIGPADGVLRVRIVDNGGCARWQHTAVLLGADGFALPDPWDTLDDDKALCELSALLTE